MRLECDGPEQALQLLPQYDGCFIELTLHLKEPLTTKETRSLRDASEGLVSLITKVQTGEITPIQSRSAMSGKELFKEYCRSLYGEDPKEELVTAFLELTEADV